MNRSLSRMVRAFALAGLGLVLAHCATTDDDQPVVEEVGDVGEETKGCPSSVSCAKPASGNYYLTSFGNNSGDDGAMACGDQTQHGSWYYAASKQRYGCGARIQIEAHGNCVVAQTDDVGPASWVEKKAKGPIIDASPLVAEHLFGVTSAGWSDHLRVHVTEVDSSTPLGPCN